jgi:hypothetical protein
MTAAHSSTSRLRRWPGLRLAVVIFATALTSLAWRRSELAVSAFVSLARDNHLSSAA